MYSGELVVEGSRAAPNHERHLNVCNTCTFTTDTSRNRRPPPPMIVNCGLALFFYVRLQSCCPPLTRYYTASMERASHVYPHACSLGRKRYLRCTTEVADAVVYVLVCLLILRGEAAFWGQNLQNAIEVFYTTSPTDGLSFTAILFLNFFCVTL